MIVATHLRTESGDDYLFLFKDMTNPLEYVDTLHNQMRSELGHVYQYDISTLEGTGGAEAAFRYELSKRIQQVRGY
jgi:hypothetical protein